MVLQEPANYGRNQFRMIITKERVGNLKKEVKFSQDLGAFYKAGPRSKPTKRQLEIGRFPGKMRRGAPPT